MKINFNSPSKVFNYKIYKNLDDYSSFTEVHYGGASSGKSHGVVLKVVLKALNNWKHPRKILFLRKVAATNKDSIFEDVHGVLSTFGILEHCTIINTTYIIVLYNVASFYVNCLNNSKMHQ